ncbi:MIZ zinc finger protein [Phyllosticta citribraziliensis]|uniref:MIZ zinc finger protein n=1 Tax=Phyllosticta citribraziliensis TaxID=989973 RepID=A0ABR1L9M8_9PEZI
MASPAAAHPSLDTLQGHLRSMVNNDLKEICRAENLKVSGVKSQLQGYITSHFHDLLRKNDIAGAWRVVHRAANPGRPLPSPSASTSGRPSVPIYPESPTRGLSAQQRTPSATMSVNSRPRQKTFPARVSFKSSPFYDVLDTVAPSMEIQVYPANRGSASSQLELSDDLASRLKAEKDLRIMLFSASDPVLAPFTPSDISFPVNIEVKVNGEEVKANFKGLKNKPGSTRPADITDFLRKLPNYTNHIQITYALTQKARKFTILVNLVRKHSAADLTDRISRGSVLSKERVKSEIINKANDEDISVNSQVVSLRDPVAGVRIQLPCRSTVCSHYECFDATYFLQLQEQAPTWTCPCCSRTISFEALVVDKYMQDILDNTSSDVDQARIYPDGTWTPGDGDKNEPKGNGAKQPVDEDDDDLVEISPRQMSVKKEASATPMNSANTPPVSSREPSSVSAVAPTSSHGKRKHEVVDLTLSDSDEDVRRPAKRHHPTYSTPSSMPDRYRQPPVVQNAYFHPSQSPNSVSSSHSHPGHTANRHHGYNVGDPVGGMPRARHSINGTYPESSGYNSSSSWLNGNGDYPR